MNGSVYYLWLQLSRGVTRPHVPYYFCQLSKFDPSQIVNGAAAPCALSGSVGVRSGQWPPSDWCDVSTRAGPFTMRKSESLELKSNFVPVLSYASRGKLGPIIEGLRQHQFSQTFSTVMYRVMYGNDHVI